MEAAAIGHGDEGPQQFEVEHGIDLNFQSIILENIAYVINITDLPSALKTASSEGGSHVSHVKRGSGSRCPAGAGRKDQQRKALSCRPYDRLA
jgi:hypothetical protein